jgi:thiosulfate/3-mercaptopyruvate sulfurtransferase
MARSLSALVLLLLPLATAGAGQPAKYVRPDLLIEAKELAKPEVAEKFRILDTRSQAKFDAGRVFRAARVDEKAWAKSFAAGPSQKEWEQKLGSLGLEVDRPVVVYGDDLRETARVWWILRYWGLRDVRILNGGWQAYRAKGGLIEDAGGKRLPPFPPTQPKLMPRPEVLATMGQLLDDLKEKRFAILDVRSEGEFCGDTKFAKRGGAIPGATHLEWSDLLDMTKQRFKRAEELLKLFKDAGVDFNRPTVSYCQSGGRASVMAFALELMGAKAVRNYYRSWSEWGNAADTPIVTPRKK